MLGAGGGRLQFDYELKNKKHRFDVKILTITSNVNRELFFEVRGIEVEIS